MALSPRLEFRQSQSLVMTPQLMQAIKLLQMSNLDLSAYVDNELEQNPLLHNEDEFSDGTRPEKSPDESPEPGEASASPDNNDWIDGPLETNPQEIAASFDTDAENVFPDDAGSAGIEASTVTGRDTHQINSTVRSGGDDDYNLEAFVAEDISLVDHLMAQLGHIITDPVQTLIARTLVDGIDPAGYVRGDLAEMAEGLGTTLTLVEETLEALQTLDPPGICARDLPECLALQLKDKNRFDPAIAALLDNLELLAKRDFPALKQLCGVDEDDLFEMISEIKALDPKPGEAFENVLSEAIIEHRSVAPCFG